MQTSPSILVEDDGISPSYYNFRQLQAEGIVRDRSDLSRLIRFSGFPAPLKDSPTMQSGARYHGASVRHFDRLRAERQSHRAQANEPEGQHAD